jgi:DNA-binding transcriptional regulator GbsR (MarR family)
MSDAPEKTFDELVKYFQASKSSISSSLNFLLLNKIIDFRTISAKRKRYFFITDSFFKVYFEKVLENVIELKEYTLRTVSNGTSDHQEVSEKIIKWIGDANMFVDALKKTLAEISRDNI